MSKDKFGYSDVYADSQITAITGEDPTFEQKYLANYTPSVKWQYSSIGIITISGDFGVGITKQIDIVSLLGTNMLSTDTTFTIGFGSTAAATDTVYDMKAVVDLNGNATIETNVDKRYWKITMDKASGTYTEMGRIFLGADLYECLINVKKGYDDDDLVEFTENDGEYGQINRVELLYEKKIFDGVFDYIATAQKELFAKTIKKEKYVIFYDSEVSKWFYGVAKFGKAKYIRSGLFSMPFSFDEAL